MTTIYYCYYLAIIFNIADPFPPPSNVMLTDVNPTQLTFSWDPAGTNCLAVKYSILAENCGSCPTKSNTTAAVCTNPQSQPNPGTTCIFRVHTEVCEGIIGGASNTSVTLRGRLSMLILLHEDHHI